MNDNPHSPEDIDYGVVPISIQYNSDDKEIDEYLPS